MANQDFLFEDVGAKLYLADVASLHDAAALSAFRAGGGPPRFPRFVDEPLVGQKGALRPFEILRFHAERQQKRVRIHMVSLPCFLLTIGILAKGAFLIKKTP